MKPGEHKTVQARILAYAEASGWTVVSREEAEDRRRFAEQYEELDRRCEAFTVRDTNLGLFMDFGSEPAI